MTEISYLCPPKNKLNMPRQPRVTSGTEIYHVMMRGINHQNRRRSERIAKLAWALPSEKEEDEVNIFEEPEDYYQFINILDRMRILGSSCHWIWGNGHGGFHYWLRHLTTTR